MRADREEKINANRRLTYDSDLSAAMRTSVHCCVAFVRINNNTTPFNFRI